jgi:hypothetical protein
VVLIGDAVHATTPHMAAGAMIGMEDAMVLAEELAAKRACRRRAARVPGAALGALPHGGGKFRAAWPRSSRATARRTSTQKLMGMTLGALAQPA